MQQQNKNRHITKIMYNNIALFYLTVEATLFDRILQYFAIST
jgi:hypothetical protein